MWRKGGLLGTHLPWRDVLHEGPVPADMSLAELSSVRAQYLGKYGYGNTIKIQRDFDKRDAVISKCREYEEIILWFEHDLFDQLQLLQILDYLAQQRLAPGKVQLIQTDDFLGMLAPEELMALQNKRRPVNAATFRLASEVWTAFRKPAPEPLFQLHDRVTSELRHLHGAVKRLFEEYPAVRTGLSRTEMQIVETVADGTHRKDDIFRLSQLREEAVYLGDSTFFKYLDVLADSPAPLLKRTEGGFNVTPLGQAVVAGEEDWLVHHPIDRWIGGVHFTPENLWRWDPEARAPRPD